MPPKGGEDASLQELSNKELVKHLMNKHGMSVSDQQHQVSARVDEPVSARSLRSPRSPALRVDTKARQEHEHNLQSPKGTAEGSTRDDADAQQQEQQRNRKSPKRKKKGKLYPAGGLGLLSNEAALDALIPVPDPNWEVR